MTKKTPRRLRNRKAFWTQPYLCSLRGGCVGTIVHNTRVSLRFLIIHSTKVIWCFFRRHIGGADNYGIRYSKVPRGCFVNRRNMEEARVISEYVREHVIRHPEESLGVVAMSAEQRLHIESTIEALAKEDSVFQDWLEKDAYREEPLFIKNLENVQGDERDVIFISMTYGPREPGGRVFQRFGPINSDVGWRRLNVLFTRSRKRMHIFSSMGSEDIIATSTSKRGIHALRDFLRFCETGILHKTERETGRDPDSDFEIAVIARLRDEGFECVPQVGVAGFFIDVAVVDPRESGALPDGY